MPETVKPCCPQDKAPLSPELVVWAHFDLIVDNANSVPPNPTEDTAKDLLHSVCAQAGVNSSRSEDPDHIEGMKALIACYRMRQLGDCAVARALSDK